MIQNEIKIVFLNPMNHEFHFTRRVIRIFPENPNHRGPSKTKQSLSLSKTSMRDGFLSQSDDKLSFALCGWRETESERT